jgi:hypothetical protein
MVRFSHHDIELYEWAELKADEEDVWSQGTQSWRALPSEIFIADTKMLKQPTQKTFFSYAALSQLQPQIDHLKRSQEIISNSDSSARQFLLVPPHHVSSSKL